MSPGRPREDQNREMDACLGLSSPITILLHTLYIHIHFYGTKWTSPGVHDKKPSDRGERSERRT